MAEKRARKLPVIGDVSPEEAEAFIKGPEAQQKRTRKRQVHEEMIRYSVDLPRSLHKQLRVLAMKQDVHVSTLVREALTDYIDDQIIKQGADS